MNIEKRINQYLNEALDATDKLKQNDVEHIISWFDSHEVRRDQDISYDKKLRQALEKAWQRGYTRGGLDAVSDYTDIKLKGLDK